MPELVAIVIFALVLGILLLVQSTRRADEGGTRAREMLDRAIRPEMGIPEEKILRSNPRHHPTSSLLESLYKLNPLRRLQETIWQSGSNVHVSEVMLMCVGIAGAGIILANVVWHDITFAAPVGVLLGLCPIMYIRWRRKRRLRNFSQQLPYALDLIKSSIEAGHSLGRGLQVMVQEFSDPLGGEFRVVLDQTQLGRPLPQALDDLLMRVPEEDLRLLVVAVKVQSEVGSSLAQIIGRLSEIVRTRQRLQQQIRAMTAQSRMSGIIVGLLPVFVLGAFSLIQPSYTHLLFYDPVGVKVLKAALVLDFLAFMTIRRILRVDF